MKGFEVVCEGELMSTQGGIVLQGSDGYVYSTGSKTGSPVGYNIYKATPQKKSERFYDEAANQQEKARTAGNDLFAAGHSAGAALAAAAGFLSSLFGD